MIPYFVLVAPGLRLYFLAYFLPTGFVSPHQKVHNYRDLFYLGNPCGLVVDDSRILQ